MTQKAAASSEILVLGDEAVGLLDKILRAQAYRELGAARLFEGAHARGLAPDNERQNELRAHAAEEREHLDRVLGVWALATGQPRHDLMARAEARLWERPLPDVETWFDVSLARFLYDRAGFWQLQEYTESVFLPHRDLARTIVEDEREHQDVGAKELLSCVQVGEPIAHHPAVTRWMTTALLSFGRQDSTPSRRAIELGLKKRDPAAVRGDFMASITPTLNEAGLTQAALMAPDNLPPP